MRVTGNIGGCVAAICAGDRRGFADGDGAAIDRAPAGDDAVAVMPADRIIVETDCPYLAPIPHRGRRNEPAFVAKTAALVADVFGMDYPQFAAQTSANFDRLFWKAAQGSAA